MMSQRYLGWGSVRAVSQIGGSLVVVALLFLSPSSAVFSQDFGGGQGPAAANPAPAAAGSAASSDSGEKISQNLLEFYLQALGWKYTILFMIISFSLVALVVMNMLAARRESLVPATLVQTFEQHLNDKRFQEAYELAKRDDSFLGQVLAAGMAKLQQGYAPAIEAMQEVGEEETMKIEHRLSYIGLLGTISPMVGLLGTVDGMVESFMVIANQATAPPPQDLAKGISTALITTLVGLWLAIPAIAIFGILKNRFQRMSLEVGIVAEQLMSRFQNVVAKK